MAPLLRALTVGLLLFALCGTSAANEPEARKRGIVGQRAPSWSGVQTWFQLPAGASGLDISSFQGKSVVLYGFQSWCPGCHSRGFPTIKAIHEHFSGQDHVAVVAVQTVFEGFGANTAERALEDVKRYGLDIPVGHDPGRDGRGSVIMKRYRSGGTPWIILIDPEGVVRYNHFRIQPAKAISMIEGWSSKGPH